MADSFKRIIRIPSRREIEHAPIAGKRVLARFDFNLPISPEGKVEDDKRIDLALPTIEYILSKKPLELNIITHFGRPKSAKDSVFSTLVIARVLSKKLSKRSPEKRAIEGQKSPSLATCYSFGTINVLENLRFDKREEENDTGFAKELATFGDIFIQDAFANIHRNHTSMVALQKQLPTYAGLLVNKEVNTLFKIINVPKKPFVAVIGGAKIEDKLPVIQALSKIADSVIVGGRTANEWILDRQPRTGNIYLPTDGIGKNGSITPINEQTLKSGIFDIGPQTIMLYKSILAPAKTVFWNGNLGMTEDRRFIHGTNEIARFIAKLKAETIVSGGNTVQVVDDLDLSSSYSFTSSGGGATSDFICSKKLPALELLLE